MRKLRNPQLERGEVRIEDIELDIKSRDDFCFVPTKVREATSRSA